MNLFQPKFHISRDTWADTNIYFSTRVDDRGGYLVALPVAMEQIDTSSMSIREPMKPMLSLRENEAPFALQNLMDQLWQLGIRPSDIGTPGHLAATTRHLEDMRAIAFGKMEIQKPA